MTWYNPAVFIKYTVFLVDWYVIRMSAVNFVFVHCKILHNAKMPAPEGTGVSFSIHLQAVWLSGRRRQWRTAFQWSVNPPETGTPCAIQAFQMCGWYSASFRQVLVQRPGNSPWVLAVCQYIPTGKSEFPAVWCCQLRR